MALSESVLSGLIKTEMEGQFGSPSDAAVLQKFCDAIAKAVVDHITSDAVVATDVANVQAGSTTVFGVGTVS